MTSNLIRPHGLQRSLGSFLTSSWPTVNWTVIVNLAYTRRLRWRVAPNHVCINSGKTKVLLLSGVNLLHHAHYSLVRKCLKQIIRPTWKIAHPQMKTFIPICRIHAMFQKNFTSSTRHNNYFESPLNLKFNIMWKLYLKNTPFFGKHIQGS